MIFIYISIYFAREKTLRAQPTWVPIYRNIRPPESFLTWWCETTDVYSEVKETILINSDICIYDPYLEPPYLLPLRRKGNF